MNLIIRLVMMAMLFTGCASESTLSVQEPANAAQETSGNVKLWNPGDAFNEMVKTSEHPVVVQCFSPWCGKCHLLSPVLERLSREYSGRADFVKVNTAEADGFVKQYEVLGLPLLLFFAKGKEQKRLMGTIEEPEIRGTLDAVLAM